MRILYNLEELRQKAMELEKCKEEMLQTMNSIDGKVNFLKGEWEGMAKDGFVISYENSKPMVNSYIEYVSKIANQIRNSALQAQEEDEQCSSMIMRGW